jgi:hypothetical protein
MNKIQKGFGIISLLILVSISNTSNAQRWFRTSALEFGIIAGASHYSGDLTQSYLETRGLKPAVGLITRYTPGEIATFRLSAQYGGLTGDDNWYQDPDDSESRNLKFESTLWDFTGAVEFNLKRMDIRETSGVIPYAFGGISVFKFNPKAQFIYDANSPHLTRPGSSYTDLLDRDGEWIELQPLGTEGQGTTEFNERERYHLTQLAIPLGAGLKFQFNNKWTLGLEYGVRITFTDYLDDVSSTYVDPTRLQSAYGSMSAAMADRSTVLHDELINNQRGNPEKDDSYGIFGVTLTYRIWGNRPKCPGF